MEISPTRTLLYYSTLQWLFRDRLPFTWCPLSKYYKTVKTKRALYSTMYVRRERAKQVKVKVIGGEKPLYVTRKRERCQGD